ncbi:hypothetical protein [Lactobacillus sp. 3B(2020)]|uniref:hypothetical protein n=1 Tax=Lactobacillus sp. 3B(2020) TaxID=2695882 RepID=UPI0015DFCA2A|nr:hypothetical protein [Lactobacillus sp. 3B(2020)]QLL70218.1 hypothetical protein GTO83_06555 [Lactobacillus sp. 3B(2020)]
MQLQRIELKKLGTTERILRSDTQGNFDKLENAVNSNASATEALTKRIAALEDMLFGQHPQEVKMAENSTPPVNGGAMLVNLTNEEDK